MAASAGVRKRRLLGYGLVLVVAAPLIYGACRYPRAIAAKDPLGSVAWEPVRRTDLDTTLLVGGELRSAVESLVVSRVEDLTNSGGAFIVSMVDSGTVVRKGDLLCELDSSGLVEMAMTEEIATIQARSAVEQARAVLEVAKISLREFEFGLIAKTVSEHESKILIARSDITVQSTYLTWLESMFANGYVSQSQIANTSLALDKARFALRKSQGELQLFHGYQGPGELAGLRAQVATAEQNHAVEASRLKFQEDRLAKVRRQIENCRILAPNDGIAIHANRQVWWIPPLAPGSRVREGQELYTIPDLSQLEVEVSIHESVSRRVEEGMRARVRIASAPDREFLASVSSIAVLPSSDWRNWSDSVRRFLARLSLDESLPGAMPMVSASAEIETGRVTDTLVVPVGAVTTVDGAACCFVRTGGGVQRRPIVKGAVTADYVEVIQGLDEGEQVASQASQIIKLEEASEGLSVGL